MGDRIYFSDDLLQPISPENPGGQNLRYDPLFTQILEARRADDQLNAGEWAKEGGSKSAEWGKVVELSLLALKERSKDLRLACFLTEGALHLDGFEGMRDCLRLLKELMYRFWDQGLFPQIEDGDLDYRASSLGWLNERMPEVMRQVDITARGAREKNYNFAQYLQARLVGTEDSIQRLPADKRESIASRRQMGWITMDAFEAAMKATKRKAFEAIYTPFEESFQNFLALEKVSDEKFGHAAPSFSQAKEAFDEMRVVLTPILKRKREEEPDVVPGTEPPPGQEPAPAAPTMAGFWSTGMPTDASGSWQQAEALVRGGSVDQGLQQMAALAAQETSGRARFLRKLMLVDVCNNAGRERLARTVLEELNTQITTYKLDQWENSALVGAVWTRLYRLYKKNEIELDQAASLYNQLCHLDPWQAYIDCED